MLGNIDPFHIRALDTETDKILPGRGSPPIVTGSMAKFDQNGQIVGALVPYAANVVRTAREYLEQGLIIATVNGGFDMTNVAQNDGTLLPLIFAAYRQKRVLDASIIQTLDAIYGGTMGIDPRTGMKLRNPATNKETTRYALATILDLVCGRTDAKDADTWRMSYALLRDVPVEFWPSDATIYPVHDTCNTLEIIAKQLTGWVRGAVEVGVDGPARNFGNSFFQAEAGFCLELQSKWSFRADPEKVEALAAKSEHSYQEAVKRFQVHGWIRPEVDPETGKPDPKAGKEDSAAVCRAVAKAYGATGECKRCRGAGKVRSVKQVECRGEKVRGRFKGCPIISSAGASVSAAVNGELSPSGIWCFVCHGKRAIPKYGDPIICKNVYADDDSIIEHGCDGSGLDLLTAPLLPRSLNKDHPARLGSISTARDSLMESGDDELAAYGEDEFQKIKNTFIPFLREGCRGPLVLKPNVLVATGRVSYEGSPFHQFPRGGGVRQCVRARGAWCDFPTEMVLSSTDYSAGELCALAQVTYWLFGYSRMRDAIITSGDPGILHSELAAEIMSISLPEFLTRLKAKDKTAVDYRQASKPKSFGAPARMGSPKIVATNRKKNAGFTVCEGGPARDEKGREGYWGIRFCVLVEGAKRCGIEKITSWSPSGKAAFAYDCAPVCKRCVEIEAYVLTPAYFRRFPEMKDFHKHVAEQIDNHKLAPSVVWDAEAGRPRIIRERGGLDFPAFCNNYFQGMVADIGKDAFITITRECYLGIKDDGSPSPLAGCRAPCFVHDEPLSELILDTAHMSGPRIGEIMIASGYKFAPDVVWKAESALSFWWDKSMESVYYKSGKLIPWGPVPDYLQARVSQMAA